MSNQLTWTEAEIFNARFESYDVYRAIMDSVTGEPGDFTLLVVLPITYDWDMAILSQTLEYLDTDADPEVIYAYKVIANASNGPSDPDGDFTQVSNVVVLGSGPDTDYLLQEDLFSILQEDGFNILIVTAPPPATFVNLLPHTVISFGGNGSGAQEPLIHFGLGAGDFVPLGQMYIGGGGLGYPFEVDGNSIGADPLSFANHGLLYTDQWWNDASTPVGANYEARLTVISGDTPGNSPVDTWISMANDIFWSYFGVFNDIPLIGVWQIEIRDATTLVVLASANMSMNQDLDG